jgi:hypothetical protein
MVLLQVVLHNNLVANAEEDYQEKKVKIVLKIICKMMIIIQ